MTATTPARTGVSPSSSPRLPSPPPFTEVQIGPKSPTISDGNHEFQLGDIKQLDDGAVRRIRPGTKSTEMASGPPLVPLNQLDSPFQLQEHLKALYHSFTRDLHTGHTTPITKETALQLAQPPLTSDTGETVDKNLWLYELCRFLTMKANNLIIAFFGETPPCSAHTCPEMRASEWQYLCAVHDPPKSCCAIDYCCHTLDWATNILTSPKYFPSRLMLKNEGGNIGASMRHLTNIFRRVYRIFAHAWFQHREVFWTVEANDGLYIFFKTVCDVYQLIPADNYTVPGEAEGHREEDDMVTPVIGTNPELSHTLNDRMQILRKDSDPSTRSKLDDLEMHGQEDDNTVSVAATTRRHKQNPSVGSQVTTIQEGSEEEEHESRLATNISAEDASSDAVTAKPVSQPESAVSAKTPNALNVLPSESDLAAGLGRLNLSFRLSLGSKHVSPAFNVPPEDPTPIAHNNVDPMSSPDVLAATNKAKEVEGLEDQTAKIPAPAKEPATAESVLLSYDAKTESQTSAPAADVAGAAKEDEGADDDKDKPKIVGDDSSHEARKTDEEENKDDMGPGLVMSAEAAAVDDEPGPAVPTLADDVVAEEPKSLEAEAEVEKTEEQQERSHAEAGAGTETGTI